MADIRIIRLGLSASGTTAAEGVELTDAEFNPLQGGVITEVGNQKLNGPISYNKIAGICTDYSGNIYGVDYVNNCVVKIEEGGRVSWVAGSTTGASGDNGTQNNVDAANALFNAPEGIAIDKSGTLYIADTGNQQIRTIKGGKVNVLAGSAGLTGLVDGDGEIARFNTPRGIVVDKAGIVWVADRLNHALRKITNDGKVLTVAGNGFAGNFMTTDAANVPANNHTATFNQPVALTVDLQGNVFIADMNNYIIKKYTADGKLYRYSGGGNIGRSLGITRDLLGNVVSQAFTCSYNAVYDLAADASGNVYVVDLAPTGSRLVKIDRNGTPAEVADWASNSYSGPHSIDVIPAGTLFVLNLV